MKQFFFLVLFAVCGLMSAQGRKQCIDAEWQFMYGERNELPSTTDWNAARHIDLPHDWSVETDAAIASGKPHVGPFVSEGGDYQNGFLLGGEGWYRKVLQLTDADREKELELYFEGVYNHATVYVNGRRIKFNHYGYQSFRALLSNAILRYNGTDEVVVKCENQGKNTRWYSGSGIFRHVWLVRKPKDVQLQELQTFVRPTSVLVPSRPNSGEVSIIDVETSLIFSHNVSRNQKVTARILDAEGKEVAKSSVTLELDKETRTAPVKISLPLFDTKPWTPDTPYLYNMELTAGSDRLLIPFGAREISYDTERGFFLNGKPILLKGACVHHDHGLLGAASHDQAELRKIQLLKEQGFNAVRCSHNLPSEYFLHVCDSLGMMVIDECFDQWLVAKNDNDYHNYFKDHFIGDFTTMLRRDRNHPSIIMWSLGNEIPGRQREEASLAVRKMRDLLQRYDPTRPATAALCGWDVDPMDWKRDYRKVTASLDIVGYNYLWGEYEHDVKEHLQVMCGLESYPKEASQNWNLVEKHPRIIGDFVWTGMDYLGEAGIGHGLFIRNGVNNPFFMPFPYYNGWCGDIDLIGQKKPQSYYRDVVWRRAPITMAMELPCPDGYRMEISGWGWQPEVTAWDDPANFFTAHNLPNIMFDGEKAELKTPAKVSRRVNVNVYSRAPQVRLYLNNRLIDTKPTSDTFFAGFTLDYQPGTLRAVEFDGEREGESFVLETPGKATQLRLVEDKYCKQLHANGTDIYYLTVELTDSKGRVVNDFERQVEFSVRGEGTILAAGNANPTDMQSFRTLTPRLYGGRAMVIVQSTKKAGKIDISVSSKGLKTQTMRLTTH